MYEKKIVSLKTFREKKEKNLKDSPVMGSLVWLHCPTCKTIQYTSVLSVEGRAHKCGAQVSEEEVSLDLRSEFTLAIYNVGLLQRLKKMVAVGLLPHPNKIFDKQVKLLESEEKQYIERLVEASTKELEIYDVSSKEDIKEKFPDCQVNELGLFVSPFRDNPKKRFK